MTRRYVVIGAGAVGAALAAGLQDAGIPVVLVSRGATYEAIRTRGLRLRHRGETRTLTVPVAGSPDQVELGGDDILVLATKTQDAAAALADWAWRPAGPGRVAADLPLVLLQNGLEAERLAPRYFRTVIGAVVAAAAKHVIPGEVEVGAEPRLGQVILGAHPAGDSRAAELAVTVAADLWRANWLTQAVPSIERWLAWKLVLSTTFAVDVLAGGADRLAELRASLAGETRTVLTRAGYEIADPEDELGYDRSLATIPADSDYGTGQLSPWQSFARGSGSEVDFLNGEIALLARVHGVPAPYNTALQRVLGPSAARGEGPGTHHVDEVLRAAGLVLAGGGS